MTAKITIALDAMGGDAAPDMVVAGAAMARKRHPNVQYIFFGDEARVQTLLDQQPALKAISSIRHTDEFIANDTKLSVGLRMRRSSMRMAIDAVAAGEADCVISAGSTGALMALAKMVLKTLPGIDRPAIGSFLPTLKGETVVLDLGANVECDADNLVQFAVMGAIFSRAILGVPEPTIGLVNVGEEEMKGHELVKTAAERLRSAPLPGKFYGFIEGDDIPGGLVDVCVMDGFTGNVALKVVEGISNLYSTYLRRSFEASIWAKIGYLFASASMHKLRKRFDPRRYNGAMFLGVGGVCVKSHGGTDAFGFANAIGVAADLVAQGVNQKIGQELERLNAVAPAAALAL